MFVNCSTVHKNKCLLSHRKMLPPVTKNRVFEDSLHYDLKSTEICRIVALKNPPYLSKITQNFSHTPTHRGWGEEGEGEGIYFRIQKIMKPVSTQTTLRTHILFHPNSTLSHLLTWIIGKLCLCCSHCGVMIRTRNSWRYRDELPTGMVKLHPSCCAHGDWWVWPTYVVRQVGGAGARGGDSPV